MMIWLAQAAPVVLPTDTAGWIGVALAALAIIAPFAAAITAWAWVRVRRAEQELVTLKTIRTEVVATVVGGVKLVEVLKILYIGAAAKDQLEMIKRFRLAGFENQVVTLDSAQSGFRYLKEHLNILFVIIYVIDLDKGVAFLEMVKDDDETQDIPVIFIDGNKPEAALAVYQGGGAGTLVEPLNFTDLLGILNKQSLSVTIDKSK